MISEPLSEEEMREAFEAFIQDPEFGIPSDSGFNSATEAAMLTVMKNPGDPVAIMKARSRFEEQLKASVGSELDSMLMEAFAKRRRK